MMHICTCACTRHPDTAANTNIQAAWCLIPSPVGSERAVAAARVWVRTDAYLPTARPMSPFRFSRRGKPLRLTQEPADAVLTARRRHRRSGRGEEMGGAKTWAPSLGADLAPRSTACDWTAKFVLKPITNFEVMEAKS